MARQSPVGRASRRVSDLEKEASEAHGQSVTEGKSKRQKPKTVGDLENEQYARLKKRRRYRYVGEK